MYLQALACDCGVYPPGSHTICVLLQVSCLLLDRDLSRLAVHGGSSRGMLGILGPPALPHLTPPDRGVLRAPRFDPRYGADTARLYAGKYAVTPLVRT